MWPRARHGRRRREPGEPEVSQRQGLTQRAPTHSDGASTIHSAEHMSIEGGGQRFVKRAGGVVLSVRLHGGARPSTSTLASTESPGLTRELDRPRRRGDELEPRRSTRPFRPAVQSTSVPICSSALEVPAVAAEPDPERRIASAVPVHARRSVGRQRAVTRLKLTPLCAPRSRPSSSSTAFGQRRGGRREGDAPSDQRVVNQARMETCISVKYVARNLKHRFALDSPCPSEAAVKDLQIAEPRQSYIVAVVTPLPV